MSMSRSRIRIVNNLPEFIEKNAVVMDKAAKRMAEDTVKLAKVRVPFEEGDLQQSGHAKKKKKLRYWALFDIIYAAYQERGYRRDGSRVVRNYTTPGTGKGYLVGAGEKVSHNIVNYLRQAANSIRMR